MRSSVKKTCCIILACFIFVFSFVGCTDSKPKNNIETMALSEDQKAIVNLISSNDQKIILFDIQTEEIFKHLEFWVETYNNGEIVDAKASSLEMSDPVSAFNGEFAVTINCNPDYQWTLIYGENGVKSASTTSEPNKNYLANSGAMNYLKMPVEIENGKEIVLYAAFFKDGGYRDFNDLQLLLDKAYLKDYDYVHLIKCRFSK